MRWVCIYSTINIAINSYKELASGHRPCVKVKNLGKLSVMSDTPFFAVAGLYVVCLHVWAIGLTLALLVYSGSVGVASLLTWAGIE